MLEVNLLCLRRRKEIGGFDIVLGGAMALCLVGATSLYCCVNYAHKKRLLVEKVVPIVERFDGKPGISFEDQTEYFRRVGVKTTYAVQGRDFNLYDRPEKELEKILSENAKK